jgi:hypothetical protein
LRGGPAAAFPLLCVEGKTKSDIIRELVRRALYARRYRQASTDPAFREMLRTVDDLIGVRLHHLEERLAGRMGADFDVTQRVLGYLYFAALFGVEEMKQVRLLLTDESVGEEEFVAAWKERLRATREGAGATLRAELEKRRRKLEGGAVGDDGRGGGEGGD